ncbi:MAG TPA: universal stress protein [Gemmatimonadaceae bacterium]|nr:universal stress protein [Gemmatimonadaceae bacterium]
MKLERIVLGMDFGAASIAAASWAGHRLAPDAELVLVHSIVVPQPPGFLRGRFPSPQTLIDTARTGADKRLREMSNSIGAQRIWLEVREGRPAEHILEVAKEYVADLIIVGKHGDRPGVWNRLGSTAELLARSSPVPVLLANTVTDSAPHRILVALDDDEMSVWVLRWTRWLADRFGATVHAVHVVSSAVVGHVLSAAAFGTGGLVDANVEEVRGDIQEASGHWMRRRIAEHFEDCTRPVDTEVCFGEAGHEIIAAAERLSCDLIVMGSQGSTAIGRALLGSVVSEVLRGAQVPTLIVRPPEDALE